MRHRHLLRRAVSLNPNDARNWGALGLAEGQAGSAKEAIEHLHQALRISPRDPFRHMFHNNLAIAHFVAKQYAKAVECALVGVSEVPNYAFLHLQLAASYVGLGDIENAKTALNTTLRLAPELVKSRLSGESPLRDPDHRKRFLTFVRIAAGLEDPSAEGALR